MSNRAALVIIADDSQTIVSDALAVSDSGEKS